jgi:predicted TIM-barrel fold metal-dependent hydrolase/predicted MFS family arabinose efflux permease
LLVVPLVAVVLLDASTFQVGLLSAATTVPFLVIALPAGVVVDRIAKRRLMIGCDAARMIIIGSVPLAYAFGELTLAQLYAVALLAGLLTVFFDVAYQSYVPSLVGTEQLVDGNGKLGATQALAQVAGPGLGGALFGLLRAGAMTVDALSYAVSTATLVLIRAREGAQQRPPATDSHGAQPRLRAELVAGLSFVVRHPVLRKIAACTGTANLFFAMVSALQIIFLVRVLHVRPAYTGYLIGAASLAGVAGGIMSGPLGRWIGTARLTWFSMLVFGSLQLLMPLAEPGWRLALFAVGLAGFAFAAVLYNISQLSYRQSICPPELLGRMNAAMRWIVWGTLPLGGVLGGTLGTAIGVRSTIWIGVVGSWLAGLFVLFSPLRTMRDIPGRGPAKGSPRAAAASPARAEHPTDGGGAMTGILDAHHHVWDLSVRDQPWLASPGLDALRRDFGLADLAPAAADAGVTATVVIQTVTDPAETPELLAIAASSPLVAAVVGWVDLMAPGVADALGTVTAPPEGALLAGIRHPVLFEPDPQWLTRPEVLRGLAAVAAAGLTYDLVVRPDQLPAAAEAAAAVPGLTFVLDHLGNPDVADVVDQPWARAVRDLAALPNTVCKLSGILGVPAPDGVPPPDGTGADGAAVAHLRPYYDVALTGFGPGRMMFGSDWPVSTVDTSYAHVIRAARSLTAELSPVEQAAVFSGTARRYYRLSPA